MHTFNFTVQYVTGVQYIPLQLHPAGHAAREHTWMLLAAAAAPGLKEECPILLRGGPRGYDYSRAIK